MRYTTIELGIYEKFNNENEIKTMTQKLDASFSPPKKIIEILLNKELRNTKFNRSLSTVVIYNSIFLAFFLYPFLPLEFCLDFYSARS